MDDSYLRSPQRWDIRLIRDFMIYIGPISSIYDFLTFYVLLHFLHASEPLFHTGWFVESLATQTLVLFVIRTMGNPLRSRPSLPLTITTIGIVVIGISLPYSPLAGILGFTSLPGLLLRHPGDFHDHLFVGGNREARADAKTHESIQASLATEQVTEKSRDLHSLFSRCQL